MNTTRTAIESGISIVNDLVTATHLTRGDVIHACRNMEKRGLGRLIVGRKGHPSRFERYSKAIPEIIAEVTEPEPWAFLTRKMSKEDADLALQALVAKYQ